MENQAEEYILKFLDPHNSKLDCAKMLGEIDDLDILRHIANITQLYEAQLKLAWLEEDLMRAAEFMNIIWVRTIDEEKGAEADQIADRLFRAFHCSLKTIGVDDNNKFCAIVLLHQWSSGFREAVMHCIQSERVLRTIIDISTDIDDRITAASLIHTENSLKDIVAKRDIYPVRLRISAACRVRVDEFIDILIEYLHVPYAYLGKEFDLSDVVKIYPDRVIEKILQMPCQQIIQAMNLDIVNFLHLCEKTRSLHVLSHNGNFSPAIRAVAASYGKFPVIALNAINSCSPKEILQLLPNLDTANLDTILREKIPQMFIGENAEEISMAMSKIETQAVLSNIALTAQNPVVKLLAFNKLPFDVILKHCDEIKKIADCLTQYNERSAVRLLTDIGLISVLYQYLINPLKYDAKTRLDELQNYESKN